MILPSLSAMMWYPLAFITSKGPGLYWVLTLDGRYLRRTWSDIFIKFGITDGLLFFNNFCVFFLVSCLLRAYLMSSILLGVGSCGNLVRNVWPKRSSPGACPVVGCGVPLCSCSILLSPTGWLLHSTITVCQAFLEIFMSPSAKSLISGSSALYTGRWSMLTHLKHFLQKMAVNKWTLLRL